MRYDEESRTPYRILVPKLEGKRPLGRPRYRLEDNIKMHFREIESDTGVELIWIMTESNERERDF
jgi:hypothetical protein